VRSEPDSVHPFRHHGRTGEVIRLALFNLALTIVTLSIWRFWGRTRVRQCLWGGTTVWSDPVEYTGTGGELFKGFLIALLLIYLPLVGGLAWAQYQMTQGNSLGEPGFGLLYLLAALMVAAGTYRARRYQMSRTVWRGIRGGQGGSALGYAGRTLLVWVAVPLSLGWALPWGEMMLARYKLGHTAFGNREFACESDSGGLYRRFAVVWVSGLGFLGAISMFALVLDAVSGAMDAVAGTLFLVAVVVGAPVTLALLW
jgi:uncharacterized membrane protein YjgN (DUF898 family)